MLLLAIMFIYIPLSFAIPVVQSDSAAIVINGHDTTAIPWKFYRDSKNIKVDSAASIYGKFGMLLNSASGSGPINWAQISAPFLTNTWYRFYFRVDSIVSESLSENASHLFFLYCSFGERERLDKSMNGIKFFLLQNSKGRAYLVVSRQTSFDKSMAKSDTIPIQLRTSYCVEINANFQIAGEMQLTMYLDGKKFAESTDKYFFDTDRLGVALFCGRFGTANWVVAVDGAAISDRRIYAAAKDSKAKNAIVDSAGGVTLYGINYKTDYHNEFVKSTRWQLFSNSGSSWLSVFDYTAVDVTELDSCVLPFSLDSGSYKWRLARQNNFGNWGNWSEFDDIKINRQIVRRHRLDSLKITGVNRANALGSIVAGKWYDLHFHISTQKWNEIGYLLAILNHPTNTNGHLGNKGGRFSEKSSYALNLSLFKGTRDLYIKKTENSYSTTLISEESIDSYADCRKGVLIVDSVNGYIRIRFRLLESALPGEWQLSATVVDVGRYASEVNSNTVRLLVEVRKPAKIKKLLVFTTAGIVLLVVVVVFFRKSRRESGYKNISDEKDDFQKIIDYLNLHLADKVTVKEVLCDLKIGSNRFYRIMRENNAEFSKLLNKLRVKRAMEYLHNENASISEAGYKSGFSDVSYFCKVFKEVVGATPSEFRNKKIIGGL